MLGRRASKHSLLSLIDAPSAALLRRDLLVRDPSQRLGAGPRGAQDVKDHIFFAPINFGALMRKEVPPPYIPPPLEKDDTSHFDSRFTAKPAEDSPSQSPEEPTAFEGFSYQAPAGFGVGSMGVGSMGVGSFGKHASSSLSRGSYGVGSFGKSLGSGGAAGSQGAKAGSLSGLPRINSGEFFSEQQDADNDTVWVPNMGTAHESLEEDAEDAGFEKLGTSLIQSSLADKSPRWRQHDSQRAVDDEADSDSDITEESNRSSQNMEDAGRGAPGPPTSELSGLQFGLDGIEFT